MASLAIIRNMHYKNLNLSSNLLKIIEDNINIVTKYSNKYSSLKANLSDKAIETRRNNVQELNFSGKNLKGILHKKIAVIIKYINSEYSKEFSMDSFSNAIASKGHQRLSEKKDRWKMLFEICGKTLLDNGLSKKVFKRYFEEYDFLDKERFNE